jgi:hypothetical protein
MEFHAAVALALWKQPRVFNGEKAGWALELAERRGEEMENAPAGNQFLAAQPVPIL